jgi:hypothetical protein
MAPRSGQTTRAGPGRDTVGFVQRLAVIAIFDAGATPVAETLDHIGAP